MYSKYKGVPDHDTSTPDYPDGSNPTCIDYLERCIIIIRDLQNLEKLASKESSMYIMHKMYSLYEAIYNYTEKSSRNKENPLPNIPIGLDFTIAFIANGTNYKTLKDMYNLHIYLFEELIRNIKIVDCNICMGDEGSEICVNNKRLFCQCEEEIQSQKNKKRFTQKSFHEIFV